MKTLVLGLGNPILSDDGVGLRVAGELRKRLDRPDVVVLQSETGGLNLLEMLVGYDRAIILDAIQTCNGRPGQVHRLSEASLEASRHANSTHGIDFKGIVELGRKLGLRLPRELVIFAVEVEDASSFGETLTHPVECAIPICVEDILQELDGSSGKSDLTSSGRVCPSTLGPEDSDRHHGQKTNGGCETVNNGAGRGVFTNRKPKGVQKQWR